MRDNLFKEKQIRLAIQEHQRSLTNDKFIGIIPSKDDLRLLPLKKRTPIKKIFSKRTQVKNNYMIALMIFSLFTLVLFLSINGFSASSDRDNSNSTSKIERATFAGGCFWCMEPPFEKLPGVSKVISGYTGGKKENPTYKEVATGSTDHAEAIEVHYNPSKISYNDLLEVLWRNIDPTDGGGQFVDQRFFSNG